MKTYKTVVIGLAIVALTTSAALLAGCGGGGGSSSWTGSTPSFNTISGSAIKGPVSNATVECFAINADGTAGNMLGTGHTDGQGNFSIQVNDYSGPVLCRMSGGNYMDEATGGTMPMHQNDTMTCVIPSMTAGSTLSGIQITPLTSMAQNMAEHMTGGMTAMNITNANNAVGNYYMVNDILHTHPMDPLTQGSGTGADQNMKNYGMSIATMSQYAKDIGMQFSSGMVTAMMNDASDGYMNGMMGNSGIPMGGGMMGGSMMSPNAGTSGMADAMTNFIQSPMNKSGVTVQDMKSLIDKMRASNGRIIQ